MKKILIQYAVCALAVALMVTLAQTQTSAPVTSFRDCSKGCPEMVVVKQGKLTMGAPAGEEARDSSGRWFRGYGRQSGSGPAAALANDEEIRLSQES